ncbi:EF-hand calcium-binding domain-containing protein 1 [Aedes aegypti]|uniref:EF-hand domain-containing protein n=1 Tax=Aedes aegypti TaxID=7159 RepID=A0A1S4G4H1_AEDAE|nr:EF-hand calcium-binding domain-containing protein 1 [Aedes aegypti]
MSLDLTLDSSEEIRFLSKISGLVRQLHKRTHFTARELEIVLLLYYKLLKDEHDATRSGSQAPIYISRQQFTTVFDTAFGMADNVMLGRIFAALDKGATSYVTMETWVHTLSLFLRGTFEEKLKYCFKVYDIQGEGMIRRDHMMLLLRSAFIKPQDEEVEEAVKDLVDIILHRMDIDRDGSISFEDYSQTVRRVPEMLECFGKALPDRGHVYAFTRTFLERGRKF